MECRVTASQHEIKGTVHPSPVPLETRAIKQRYTVFYTCQTHICQILFQLQSSSGSLSALDHQIQLILSYSSASDNKFNYGKLPRANWKIKASCIHLTEGDFSWMSKISHLQNIHLATSELINWLSTLGGRSIYFLEF